jgi:hypothetical protein
MKKISLMLFCIILASCSTVTISPSGSDKISSAPNYQKSEHFFLWGLVGETRVNVESTCLGEQPAQMQSQSTFGNELFSLLTFGLYTPHTVKVWCK